MTDPIDWSQTTHDGNRRRQHLDFGGNRCERDFA